MPNDEQRKKQDDIDYRDRWITSELTRIRDLLEEREKATQREYTEFRRRLDGLNHDHERTKETQRDYVDKAVYDRDFRELREKAEKLAQELRDKTGIQASRQDVIAGRDKGIGMAWGAVTAILTLLTAGGVVTLISVLFKNNK